MSRDFHESDDCILAVDYLCELGARVGAVRAVDLLGGAQVFGHREEVLSGSDPLLWDRAIAEGLPQQALNTLLQAFRKPPRALLRRLGIKSSPTKWNSSSASLAPGVAAGTVAVAHLIESALEVMGSPESADRWLSAPNQALGGIAPIDLVGREVGNKAVADVLTSVRHGMFG